MKIHKGTYCGVSVGFAMVLFVVDPALLFVYLHQSHEVGLEQAQIVGLACLQAAMSDIMNSSSATASHVNRR
jgi:hypothetical protein